LLDVTAKLLTAENAEIGEEIAEKSEIGITQYYFFLILVRWVSLCSLVFLGVLCG
jgi:hypothetical protein